MSELYELPDGWEWSTLNDVCNKITDGTHKSPQTVEKGNPYITVKDIDKNGNIDFYNCKFISDEDFQLLIDGNCMPNNGDVLFSKDGTVGKVALVNYETKFVVLSSLAILRPSDLILSQYLAKFLQSPLFLDKAIKSKTGAAIKRVVLRTIKSFKIPLPPLQEQKRIVAKLDALFDRIDKAIALHQQNINQADAFMGSVLNEVFGELEGRYEKIELFKLVKIIGGGTPSKSNNEYWEDGTIMWASVRDMNTPTISKTELMITEKGLKESSSNIVPKKAIVLATRVGLGKVCYLKYDTAINQDLKGLLPLDKNLEIRYLYNYFTHISSYIVNNGTGATVKGVRLDFIKSIKIPLPPLKTQQKTVAYLDQISNKIEQIKTLQSKKMQNLKELKASLLDKAFRGEL